MSDQASKPRQWTMAESILHFQDGVRAVGPMIHVIEYSAFEAQAQQLASLRAEIQKLEAEHTQHVADLESNSKATYKHNNQLVKECVELREEIEAANDVVKDLADMMNKAIAERDSLKVELAKANTKEFAANLKIAELKSKLEAAEKLISDLKRLMKASVKVQIEAFAPQILEEECGALKAEVERWKSEAFNHARVADQCAAEKLSLLDELDDMNEKWADSLGAKIESLVNLNNRYRTALEKARAELEMFNFAKDEIRVRSADDILFKALADAPETGPSKDAVIEKFTWLVGHAIECASISRARGAELLGVPLIDLDSVLKAAKGTV